MTKEALTLAIDVAINAMKDATKSIDKLSAENRTLKEALAQPERDYERGFIDGMQKQMQSSVDKAVNTMSQRTWVGLTWEEIDECFKITPDQYLPAQIYKRIEAKLKEKNQ